MKKIILVILLTLVFGTNAYAGLVGYWDFNEGAGQIVNDLSPFDNDGFIGALPIIDSRDPQWTQGKFGSGLQFDPSNSTQVIIPPTPSLIPGPGFSIMAWLNLDYLSKQTIYHNNTFSQFNVLNDSFEIELSFNDGGGAQLFYSNSSPIAGQWSHIAVTYDGSDVKYYFNGNLDGTTPVSRGDPFPSNKKIVFGSLGDGQDFAGKIDEIRIYNTGLTQDEIIRDMNFDSTAVPEPSTMLLLGAGLLGGVRFRKKSSI